MEAMELVLQGGSLSLAPSLTPPAHLTPILPLPLYFILVLHAVAVSGWPQLQFRSKFEEKILLGKLHDIPSQTDMPRAVNCFFSCKCSFGSFV